MHVPRDDSWGWFDKALLAVAVAVFIVLMFL